MNKNHILNLIADMAASKEISHEEMNNAFYAGLARSYPAQADQNSEFSRFSFSKISVTGYFFLIGGLVVLVGAMTFLAQFWNQISIVARILTTLGFGLALYISGALFEHGKKIPFVSDILFILSIIFIPIGLGVLFKESGLSLQDTYTQVIIEALLMLFAGMSIYFYKKGVFVFLLVLSGASLYLTVVHKLLANYKNDDVYKFVYIFLGVALIALGHYLSQKIYHKLSVFLYLVGAVLTLAPLMALRGIYEIIYLFVNLAFFYLSTKLRSSLVLVVSSIMLAIYVIVVTDRYFDDSMSWSLTLVMIGFLLMAIGYLTYYLNRKYIGLKSKTIQNKTS
jgi:hypothetical protein